MRNIGLYASIFVVAACGVFDLNPRASRDLIVLDSEGSKLIGCWMLKKGDGYPRENIVVTVDRRTMVVENGQWDEPLSRVGLTPETCKALSAR